MSKKESKSEALSLDEAKKIVTHYGKSEKEGEYDSTEVRPGITVGDARKLVKAK